MNGLTSYLDTTAQNLKEILSEFDIDLEMTLTLEVKLLNFAFA